MSLGLELVVSSMQVRIPAYWTLIQERLDLGSGPRFLDVNVGKMKLDFRPIVIIVESPWGLRFRLEGHSSPVENRISSASSHIFLYTHSISYRFNHMIHFAQSFVLYLRPILAATAVFP